MPRFLLASGHGSMKKDGDDLSAVLLFCSKLYFCVGTISTITFWKWLFGGNPGVLA